MYLAAESDFSPRARATAYRGDAGNLRQRLWDEVRTAFPDLSGAHLRIEHGGGDHLLLIADETRAFRFPRPGTHGLDLEIKLLRSLARSACISVPDYDVVDPKGCFASYVLIAGESLTAERFAALSAGTGRSAVADAVKLLKRLHAIDPATIDPDATWPRMWSAGQFADRLQDNRVPAMAGQVQELMAPIAHFLRRYRADRPPCEVVLHGDLVGDHMLVDEHTGQLVGIIDFSDVALGDPAHDFLGFWAYGANAASHAVNVYGQADATLLARSRNHFIRYRIDRLFEMIVEGAAAAAIQAHSAALAILLAEPSQLEP